MNRELGINPWLSIWIHPRKTIRAIIDYRIGHRFLLLCFLNGALNLLMCLHLGAIGSYNLLTIFVVSLLLAIPYGYISFTVAAFGVFIVGKLIKGKGTFKQVRTAISWASIPQLVVLLLMLLGLIWMKADPSLASRNIASLQTGGALIGLLFFYAFTIWGVIIWLHLVGEVQKFSAWMALLNAFLAVLIFVVISIAISFIVAFLTDREGDHVQVYKTGSAEVVLVPRELFLT
ncbi:MAG: YIP1 family protein [Chlamydiota bacterium]